MFKKFVLASAAVAALGAGQATAADLKIAHFVTPKHSVSQWIANWSKKIEAGTAGEVKFTIFPGGQLGRQKMRVVEQPFSFI